MLHLKIVILHCFMLNFLSDALGIDWEDEYVTPGICLRLQDTIHDTCSLLELNVLLKLNAYKYGHILLFN